MNYGYARISTINQHIDRQIEALLKSGIKKKIFILIMNQIKILIEKTIKN